MKVFDRINKVNHVKIIDSVGITRNIWARYVKDYPVGNNDWGDFQTHRRLLGLITVGMLMLNNYVLNVIFCQDSDTIL